MEQLKSLTLQQRLSIMIEAVDTMTQQQIDACAWCMGGGGCDWTKESLKERLIEDRDKQKMFTEVMG
jgi:hypothetical protein